MTIRTAGIHVCRPEIMTSTFDTTRHILKRIQSSRKRSEALNYDPTTPHNLPHI